jgi:REP element-mobilizing transposase RayT
MPYYERRLPHWDPEDAAIFVTWRLHGSFPAPPPEWDRLPPGKRFVAEDDALANSSTGPHYLRIPAVAEVVANALKYRANTLHLYDLRAWVIMSNHVHMLIDPHAPIPRITGAIKSYSAKQANIILDRTGQSFWALESYDRWVRRPEEFEKIVRYIEYNPVKAGIVTKPEDYRWSSAGQEARVTCEIKS